MTALDTNIGGANTLGGTLAATLGTLNGGTLGGGNTKKMSKAFGNAWRGAAAYHYYMLSLKQFYDGELVRFVAAHVPTVLCVRLCAQNYHFALPISN